MPLFWFVSFATGIKRIRDKTFCFNVQLGSNLCTRHTSRIHGAGCNSKSCVGFRTFELPPLLLEKQATTNSLSQNMFCQLQAKGEWLTILESLKRKTKVLLRAQTIKRGCSYELKKSNKRCSYELKRIYICGVYLGFLPQTSLGGTCLLSPSLPVLVRLLPRVDLGVCLYPYLFYHAYMFSSCRICERNLYSVLACLTPEGYVHNFWLV